MFDTDPKKNSAAARLPSLTYAEALSITLNGAKVLHPRCIQLAQKNGLHLHVRSFKPEDNGGTLISEHGVNCSQTPQYEEN